jgi:hypothetical protein
MILIWLNLMRMYNIDVSELLPFVMDYRLGHFNLGNWLLHDDGDFDDNPSTTATFGTY